MFRIAKALPFAVLIALASLLGGCATATRGKGNVSSRSLVPLSPDRARIHFSRGRGIFNAAVAHCVLDVGTGIKKNSTLIENKTFPVSKGNFAKVRNVKYLECKLPTWFPSAPRQLVGSEKPLHMPKPNASFVGSAKSGGTLVWDRPPGAMRLRVITPSGDETFAPSVTVKAGKTYRVTYWYMQSRFDIKEL